MPLQTPVKKWPTSHITHISTEKSKHIHLDIAGDEPVSLHFHAGSKDTADEIIDKQGLKQVTDSGAIEAMIDAVLAANPKSVDEFRAGKEKAFNALVGQVMKASKGKASPAQVNELLKQKLGG